MSTDHEGAAGKKLKQGHLPLQRVNPETLSSPAEKRKATDEGQLKLKKEDSESNDPEIIVIDLTEDSNDGTKELTDKLEQEAIEATEKYLGIKATEEELRQNSKMMNENVMLVQEVEALQEQPRGNTNTEQMNELLDKAETYTQENLVAFETALQRYKREGGEEDIEELQEEELEDIRQKQRSSQNDEAREGVVNPFSDASMNTTSGRSRRGRKQAKKEIPDERKRNRRPRK